MRWPKVQPLAGQETQRGGTLVEITDSVLEFADHCRSLADTVITDDFRFIVLTYS